MGKTILYSRKHKNKTMKLIKICKFSVIDGDYGLKGEAGMPGRFGYDGFPGNINQTTYQTSETQLNTILILNLNIL